MKISSSVAWFTTAVLCAILKHQGSQAFSNRRFAQPRSTLLCAENDKKETLVFTADSEFLSDPIQGSKDDFVTFFRRVECRNLLLSAGGTKKLYPLSPTESDLVSLWKDRPELLPEDGDELVAVETSVKFPGIMLETIVCSAVKSRTAANGLPMYESLFIAEKQSTRGLAPLVWLFEQLTGSAKKPKNTFLAPSANARAIISIVENNGSYAVKYALDFKIEVVFPRALLRILPSSKEKMEEQGSASVSKAVYKDIKVALDSVCEAFNARGSIRETINP